MTDRLSMSQNRTVSGTDSPVSPSVCSHCEGSGEVWESCGCYQCEYSSEHSGYAPCRNCDGTGTVGAEPQLTPRGMRGVSSAGEADRVMSPGVDLASEEGDG